MAFGSFSAIKVHASLQGRLAQRLIVRLQEDDLEYAVCEKRNVDVRSEHEALAPHPASVGW